jgi:putative tryptophan/tyrosine transport system substrate-binding protein
VAINIARRKFIVALGGTAFAWPLAARAEQSPMPVIGFLSYASRESAQRYIAGFYQGLKEAGFVEGQNVAVEYRWAEGRYEELPALAADLVHRQVAVILSGGSPSALAAKAATATIPIIFTSGDDPIRAGLVASLSRPGGNVTGVYSFFTGLETKRLGLLRELVPQAKVVLALVNLKLRDAEIQSRDLEAAAGILGQQIPIINASSETELDTAFATISQLRAEALLVSADPFFIVRREQIVALAARYAIPAIYFLREFVASGGLMSYGTSLADSYRLAGIYTGRVLKGDKPAELPVVQATKFEFVINLKTANDLGLSIPSGVLAIADEVIE